MVGLASLFLTIIYIGAIFLRKKFSSALASFIGVSSGHSHQMSATMGRLARRMLLDIGLDALPLIGPILGGRRRRSESGESGLSTMDEIKLWWKSRRDGKSGPVYDRSIEGRPPVGRPDAENPNSGDVGGPSSPETNTRFNGRTERDDRPVFVYADRKSAAPEEGTPPEPAGVPSKEEGLPLEPVSGVSGEDRRADSGSGSTSPAIEGDPGDGNSLSRLHGKHLKQNPSEIPAAQQETAKGSGAQAFKPQAPLAPSAQKTGKLSNFYEGSFNEKADNAPRVRPKEAYPAERALPESNGAEIRQDLSDNLNRLGSGTPKMPAPGPAEREIKLEPEQGIRRTEQRKNIALREAVDASSSRLGEHKPAQTSPVDFSRQEVPARNKGGDKRRLPQEQRKAPPARESRSINQEASPIGRGSKNDVSINKTIESQVPTAGRDAR